MKENLQTLRQEVLEQIGDGYIERAFSTLEAYLRHESEAFTAVILIKSRFSLLQIQRRKNLYSKEEHSVELSRISESLMFLIKEFKQEDFLQNFFLNEDYEDDWTLFDYFEEYQLIQKKYITCLHGISNAQKEFIETQNKASSILNKLKEGNSPGKSNHLNSLLKDMARDLIVFTDTLKDEIRDFDVLTAKTYYYSFKVIEHMFELSNKVNYSFLFKLIDSTKDYKKHIEELKNKLEEGKKSFGKKINVGREYNAARRRALKEWDVFSKKCGNISSMLDRHEKNVKLLMVEHKLRNSWLLRLLNKLGLKKTIIIKKTRYDY